MGERGPNVEELWKVRDYPGDWIKQAACASGLGNWFPGRWAEVTAERLVCQACPVQRDCLAHALAAPERYGIWGGLTEQERRDIRRGLRRDRAA
jgi:WhiB family redox-sensing transcriptional regulator